MQKAIIIILMCLSQLALAQRFSITGEVYDHEDKPLPYATVMLLKAADSSMLSYAVSSTTGQFEIKHIQPGEYLVKIAYVGFNTYNKAISTPKSGNIELGKIKLTQEDKLLSEVKVQGERIPMLIKNDTIEYDALAFKARPNEVVEDLLKRMPGIEVESDGTVKAQGENVQRVTVDGKEFFGRDPKMATQNLPADAVSKVQVFDRKSEQAQFSGIDDGQREKTINLELKEDKKKGAFGNTSAGYGTDNRFAGKTNINRFNKSSQLSVLGMANNVNQQGFSFGEYMNFTGGAQQMMGGGGRVEINIDGQGAVPLNTSGAAGMNGIMTTLAGGLNFNQNIGKKTEANGSYFYNRLSHYIEQDTERENFMPDGRSFDFEQNSKQDNLSETHRASTRIEHKPDSSNNLLFTANAGLSNNNRFSQNESSTFQFGGELQNESEQVNRTDGQSLNMDASLLWRHRLAKKGRTLSTGLTLRLSESETEGTLEAINRFFGANPSEQLINQLSFQQNLNRNLGFNTSYTEPLGKRRYLEANYRIAQNRNESDQEVYDLDEGIRTINELLTNKFESDYLYQRGGLNFRLNRKKYNLTLGAAYQATNLKGFSESLDFRVDRDFNNVLPVARFNYEFSSMRRMSFDYETSVQEPSLTQLQPLLDNRDPLNLYVGNPDLRPAYRHSGRLNFSSFNPTSFLGFFAFVTGDYVTNAITTGQSVDENLVRLSSPVNVSSNFNLRGNFNLTFPIRPLKSRINMGSTLSRNMSFNVLNEQEQQIFNNILSGNIRYNFRPVDAFELNLTANVNKTLTEFEFSNFEQAFLNQVYGAEMLWDFLKGFRSVANFRYMMYQGVSSEFDQVIPMLDVSLARPILKNKSLEAKVSASNLLNINLGVTQSANANYWERQITNNLGRYYMFSLTYSLNRQLNMFDGGNRRRGGGAVMITN